jgi:hypothetical protein
MSNHPQKSGSLCSGISGSLYSVIGGSLYSGIGGSLYPGILIYQLIMLEYPLFYKKKVRWIAKGN